MVEDGTVTDPATQIEQTQARLELNPTVEVGDVMSIPTQPAPPSLAGEYPHFLGTDPHGRDILSQLLYSTRAAFFLGAVAALTTVLIATTVGAIAAYFGGWIDSGLMRFADLILLMPLLPVLILLERDVRDHDDHAGAHDRHPQRASGAWPSCSNRRRCRSRSSPTSTPPAWRAASDWHVIFRHIVPNVLPLSFLYMMFGVTEAIAIEATLSFFGLLNVPMTWGIMINSAQTNGYLLSGTELLVAALPGRSRRLVPVLRLLPGRPRHG